MMSFLSVLRVPIRGPVFALFTSALLTTSLASAPCAHSSLWLNDASGDVYASDLGSVTVIEDGSGALTFVDVTGNVDITADDSGDITVERVGGSVRIGRDGSGGVSVRSVDGNVLIEEDRSGEIDIQEVGNDVH
ncbi:MAG: hypothetical protein R6W77_09825, partial [Trueperaceae bacterium]